jgi:hypothetical protein
VSGERRRIWLPGQDRADQEQARKIDAEAKEGALVELRRAQMEAAASRQRLHSSPPKRQKVRTKAQIHGRARSKRARSARKRQRARR